MDRPSPSPKELDQMDIVLFDGVCNFCNGTINFLMDRDSSQRLKFAPLQSEAGQQLLRKHHLPTDDFKSFVFITQGKVYQQSTAALKIACILDGGWKALYGLIIVPAFLRNAVYALIARNRYRWFGKMDACRIPSPQERARFLS